MALDVNKIIEESLKEANSPITESIEGGIQAIKRSASAAGAAFAGGSAQDEAEAAKAFAGRAAAKLGESEPESIVAKHYLKQISQSSGDATGNVAEAKEKVAGLSSKIANVMREHPGMSFAAAAAIAAGLGALALRKKLSGVAKHKKNKED